LFVINELMNFELRYPAMMWAVEAPPCRAESRVCHRLSKDAVLQPADRICGPSARSRPPAGWAVRASEPLPSLDRGEGQVNIELAPMRLRFDPLTIARKFWKSHVIAHWSCSLISESDSDKPAEPRPDLGSFGNFLETRAGVDGGAVYPARQADRGDRVRPLIFRLCAR
jgi:hypothetical protein